MIELATTNTAAIPDFLARSSSGLLRFNAKIDVGRPTFGKGYPLFLFPAMLTESRAGRLILCLPALSSLLVLSLFPGGIGVVLLHGFGENIGLLAQILLIHHSVLAHNKRHHAG